MAFVLWRVLLARRSDPSIAFGAFVIVLFLGISFWHKPATIGNLISLSVAMLAALCLRVTEPRLGHKFLFGILLASGRPRAASRSQPQRGCSWSPWANAGSGVGGRQSTFPVSAGWPGTSPLLLPGEPGRPRICRSRHDIACRLLGRLQPGRTGTGFGLSSPAVYGPLLLVLLTVALVFLGLRGRLDRYDAVTIGILVIYLAMVVCCGGPRSGEGRSIVPGTSSTS